MEKLGIDQIVFIQLWSCHTLQPYILYESHNAPGQYVSTRLYNFIRRQYYWKKLHQQCNKYVQSCPECQQVTLKEPQYINLHLLVLQFPMTFLVWTY